MAQILIVEPDAQLAQIYKKSLELNGHNVRTCTSAEAAIESIDTAKPDLIIAELELATHNGVELLYELRSYGDWQAIPVIVLTNQPFADNSRSLKAWQQLKVAGHFYKPHISLRRLSEIVSSHLAVEIS